MDLIDRQTAIERATKDHDFYKGATIPTDKARRDESLNVMCWLGELPSAQPEIVMCKDCKKYIDYRCRDEHANLSDWRHEDDYCSYAERREDDHETD